MNPAGPNFQVDWTGETCRHLWLPFSSKKTQQRETSYYHSTAAKAWWKATSTVAHSEQRIVYRAGCRVQITTERGACNATACQHHVYCRPSVGRYRESSLPQTYAIRRRLPTSSTFVARRCMESQSHVILDAQTQQFTSLHSFQQVCGVFSRNEISKWYCILVPCFSAKPVYIKQNAVSRNSWDTRRHRTMRRTWAHTYCSRWRRWWNLGINLRYHELGIWGGKAVGLYDVAYKTYTSYDKRSSILCADVPHSVMPTLCSLYSHVAGYRCYRLKTIAAVFALLRRLAIRHLQYVSSPWWSTLRRWRV